MKKIRIGLIGCGKQALKHVTSLKNIPSVELVLSDIRKDFAEDLARKTGTECADHPDRIFDNKDVRAVVICTPTLSHGALIKRAIEAEKDVFCEKPLSDSMEETAELVQLVLQSGRMVMTGYIYRYVPIFEEGYRIFRERTINGSSLVFGRLLTAFFRLGGRGDHQVWKHMKSTGGGAINEMLVHMVDLANWYFGPIVKVEVISCDLRCPQRVIQKKKVNVDAEDYIVVKCFGMNGIEIILQADLITPAFSQYVEIQGENGTFFGTIQSDLPSYIFLKERRGGYDAGRTNLMFGQRNLFDIQMMSFVQASLEKELQDRNTMDDSLELLKTMTEIRRQVEGRV